MKSRWKQLAKGEKCRVRESVGRVLNLKFKVFFGDSSTAESTSLPTLLVCDYALEMKMFRLEARLRLLSKR